MGVLWHWASDVGLRILFITNLSKSPIIVNVARESGIWVSVHRHWASNIWLWVLLKLSKSPIVVDMARESGIWMSVHWHWTSKIGRAHV